MVPNRALEFPSKKLQKLPAGAAVFGSNVLQSCQLELLSLAQMYCKVASWSCGLWLKCTAKLPVALSAVLGYCKVASWSCGLWLKCTAKLPVALSAVLGYCKVAGYQSLVLGRGGPRKSSSCLTAAGLPRLVSLPAAFTALGAPHSRKLQLLAAFVGARKAPASSMALMRRSVRSLLWWNRSALSWSTRNSVAGCSTSSSAACAVSWGRALYASANPPPFLATRVMALRSSGRFVRCTASGSSRSSVANSLPRSVVTTKFLSSAPLRRAWWPGPPSRRSCSANFLLQPPG